MNGNINKKITRRKKSFIPKDLSHLRMNLLTGDINAISKAITLTENSNHRYDEKVLTFLTTLPEKENSLRIAVTGPPGAGKSTFIEALGMHFIRAGYKVAVIAIDPASETNRGSILGDKTRMTELSRSPNAYIRPSSNILEEGGIRSSSFHTIRLCEAAGFDIILLETVGVGQSEIKATHITDLTVLLLTPTGGDELQGIKKGIIERANFILVNKADGVNIQAAAETVRHYKNAVHLQRTKKDIIETTSVASISAIENEGISELVSELEVLMTSEVKKKEISEKRIAQNKRWLLQEAKSIMLYHLENGSSFKHFEKVMQSEDPDLSLLTEFNNTIAKKVKKL